MAVMLLSTFGVLVFAMSVWPIGPHIRLPGGNVLWIAVPLGPLVALFMVAVAWSSVASIRKRRALNRDGLAGTATVLGYRVDTAGRGQTAAIKTVVCLEIHGSGMPNHRDCYLVNVPLTRWQPLAVGREYPIWIAPGNPGYLRLFLDCEADPRAYRTAYWILVANIQNEALTELLERARTNQEVLDEGVLGTLAIESMLLCGSAPTGFPIFNIRGALTPADGASAVRVAFVQEIAPELVSHLPDGLVIACRYDPNQLSRVAMDLRQLRGVSAND
jgi:hypothetical protein